MCGICGFFEFNKVSSNDDVKKNLLKMCTIMEHRGPDDLGTYISGTGMNLGAVRLSIIDLSGGHQPIPNEDGTCWVALNGEIYNYPSLRNRLESFGHTFSTNCDTEAVIHAYEQWGTKCAQYLDGMFAFAIIDQNRQRMMLARDRLGQKPLYYAQDKNELVFGSEIKSVQAFSSSSFDDLDEQAIDMFLSLGYIPGPFSVFKNIKKLLPGHYLIIDRHQSVESDIYWDISNELGSPQIPQTLDEATVQLAELIEKSVEARLLADVPIGVFLSGGIDSSIVTALTNKYKKDQLKSFSVRFIDPEHDESSFAKTVANHLGTEHYELDANHCSPELIRKLLWHCDEPLADPAIVPTYLVSKLAREQVKVVLTGEGADEFFAGYFYHPLEKKAASLDWIPPWVKRNLLTSSARIINKTIGRPRYHHRTIWSWQLDPAERMLAWMSIFTDDEKERWFSPPIHSLSKKQPTANHFRQVAQTFGDYDRNNWLQNFMYIDAKIPLVDDLLMKVDKMSMAASLEARCPFLDHRLVEYAFNLPEAMKLHNGTNKLVLRKIASDILPKEISNRKKHGFDVPLKRWLTKDLNTLFWDLVTSKQFESRNIIPEPQIQEIWADMLNDVAGSYRQVWSILVLATWMDVFTS